MTIASDPSAANLSGVELAPENRTSRRAILLLVAFTVLAHLPLVMSDAVLWDSAPLANVIEQGDFGLLYRLFRSSGAPQTYYLHLALAQFPDFVHAYKWVALLSLIGATVCTYWLAQTVRFIGQFEAFAIAAVAAVFPFYSVRQELINVPSAVCYFLFLLGACCYSRFLSEPATSKRWLLVSLLLLLMSFATQSLLVYFYALFLFFFLRQECGHRGLAAFRFFRRNAIALALPIAYFFAVRWLFPTDGVYESYNKIQLSPLYLAKWVAVIPKRVALDPLRDFGFAAREPRFFLALAAYAAVALLPAFWARRLPSRQITGRQFAVTLGFAIVLFYLGVFPYAVVGKFPVLNSYGSRHGLLVGLPLGIAVVATLRCALRKENAFALGLCATLLCCLVSQTRAYVLWQNRYLKYLAIIEHLEKKPDTLAHVVVLEDNADFGMAQPMASYEVNWLTKQAFGNERHMGFGAPEFNEETYRRMDVPVKREYYMARGFRPGSEASRIHVERNSDDSELGIYLGYFGAGARTEEFLDRLVKLSITPEQVPFDVSVPANDSLPTEEPVPADETRAAEPAPAGG